MPTFRRLDWIDAGRTGNGEGSDVRWVLGPLEEVSEGVVKYDVMLDWRCWLCVPA